MNQYGIIARKEGLFMIAIPSDFDLQMMSNEEYDKVLNETSLRLKGVTAKMIINLIDEAGDFLMNKDYRTVVKLQHHEAEILLNSL